MAEQPSPTNTLTVSVVIATYNRADFLPETLASLLDQTRVPDEIIVIDDGSTDHTPALLADYGPPIRVIRQPNRGQADARNTGIETTQCDVIAFLDSDDTLLPTNIEQRAHYLETHPAVDVVYSDVHVMEAGRILGRYSQLAPRARPSGAVFANFARENLMPPHGFMLRRACLEDERFDTVAIPAEDYDLWVRLSARYQFHYIDEPLAIYRVHDSMTTRVHYPRMVAANALVMRRIRDMPAFAALAPAEQAAIYRMHGRKYGYMGRMALARRMFRSAQQCQFSLMVWIWWLLTWSGRKGFAVTLSMPARLRGDLSTFG